MAERQLPNVTIYLIINNLNQSKPMQIYANQCKPTASDALIDALFILQA